jgi:ketosteroid isomerase-like protein
MRSDVAIAIDNQLELRQELETFLATYEKATNSRDFTKVDPFIADDATFWFTNGTFTGKESIRKAFEDTWAHIQDEAYTISDIRWVAANDSVTVCAYTFKSDGIVDGKRQIYEGHGTNVLKRLDGKWRIVHEHLSK